MYMGIFHVEADYNFQYLLALNRPHVQTGCSSCASRKNCKIMRNKQCETLLVV